MHLKLFLVLSGLFLFDLCARADTSLTIEWDPNLEPYVTGYNVYYGTISHVYTSVVNVGNSTRAKIAGLIPGKRYFFAVTAYDVNGLESPFSEEVTTVLSANIGLPFWYDFRVNGTLTEAQSSAQTSSAYWWLKNGIQLTLQNGVGNTGTDIAPSNPLQLFLRKKLVYGTAEIYFLLNSNANFFSPRSAWNGVSLYARYQNEANHYFASVRADGTMTLRAAKNGTLYTLLSKKVFPGIYVPDTGTVLIPTTWIGLKFLLASTSTGMTKLSLYIDIGRTRTWTLVGEVVDDLTRFGPPIVGEGLSGVRSDYRVMIDDFRLDQIFPLQTLTLPSLLVKEDETDSTPFQLRFIGSEDSNRGSLEVRGPVGEMFTLEHSTNLIDWSAVFRGSMDDHEFIYTEPKTLQKNFYRILRHN